MSRKNKNTRIVIYLLGFLCGSIFLLANLKGMNINGAKRLFSKLVIYPRKYGDLYYGNYLDKYKVEISRKRPFSVSGLSCDLEKAELILYGDSFSNYRYFEGLPEMLIDSLNLDLHFAHHRYQGKPLNYLNSKNYKGGAKFLIFETVERELALRLKHISIPKRGGVKKSNALKSKFKNVIPKNVKNAYSLLIQDSKLTRGAYSIIMNSRYDWFGYVNAPEVYDDKSGMLFSDNTTIEESTRSFYYEFSDKEIERYCRNIEILRDELKNRYNLELIFLPIPNKYTIYHDILNSDKYNGLLPRLNECLKEKGITYIDLYSAFNENKKPLLFYKTDTHWNKKGASIALDLLIEEM